MREIKYQCIYRPTGEVFEPDRIDLVNKSVVGTFDGKRSHCYYSLEPNGYGDAWLREYAGRLDKNGLEIYEGDIIIYGLEIPYTEAVDFREGAFGTENHYLADIHNIEVIGNIHDNPSLLEVTP
jgi:hypothetical protein